MAERWWRRRVVEAVPEGSITGVLGTTWRARVTPWGDVHPLNGSAPLRWFVAADDRWHAPRHEVATRQAVIDGAPVFETRVRVPGGDVVQRIWSTLLDSDRPATVVDFVNDSSMPVVVAVAGNSVLTERPVTPSVAPGLDRLGSTADEPTVQLPIGHRASVRVLVAPGVDRWVGTAGPDAVVRGWRTVADRAGRLVVPVMSAGRTLTDSIAFERCQMALDVDSLLDPLDRLIALDQRSRMNVERVDPLEVVDLLHRHLRPSRGRSPVPHGGPDLDRLVFAVAERLLADDPRALDDLRFTAARRAGRDATDLAGVWPSAGPIDADRGPRLVASTEDRLARVESGSRVSLMPHGFPVDWLGQSIEVHGLAVGGRWRVSFAVRWHGERAAVLWEIDGPPGITLGSGVDRSWSSTASAGEALWSV